MRRSIIILLSLCVSGAAWGQDAIQSADGRYGIIAGARGPRVANDRGASIPLDVPSGVRLRHLAPLRGGWIATGSQRVGVRDELFLRMLDPGGLKRIPAPGFQIGSMRQQPVVLSDGERLLGMLWLEGDARIFLNDLLDLPQPMDFRVLYDAMDNATRNGGKPTAISSFNSCMYISAMERNDLGTKDKL